MKGKKLKKKVLVGMSGGVDSSVAACLLLDQGYEVVGVHMKYWADDGASAKGKEAAAANKCCTVESTMKAIYVCRKLKIPLLIFDFRQEFKKRIVDGYIAATAAALTPNPCVECNRTIKFGLFLDKMKELGADCIATGHYARIRETGGRSNPHYELLEARDRNKDQSYFLYTLSQRKLRHIIFPLGGLLKSEVRKLALKYGLEEINAQKESQNLCFLPDGSREDFLRRHLGVKKLQTGPIITAEGKELGKHFGLAMYTVGQRKGICIGGGPALYVTGTDLKKNTLIVGGEDKLYRKNAFLKKITFVSGTPLPGKSRISVKIRYRHHAVPAVLKITSAKKGQKKHYEVVFAAPQRAVTPGQSAVFYRRGKVLGGGVII